MVNRWGNTGNNGRLYFRGAPKSLQMVTAAMKLKDAYSLEEKLDRDQIAQSVSHGELGTAQSKS